MARDDVAGSGPNANVVADPAPPARRQRWRLPLLIGGVVIAAAVGTWLYLGSQGHETTDNAYIQAGLVAVSANVSGPVIAVEVHENSRVKKGDVLFRIDPAPFQVAVAAAEADLANARTQVEAQRATYAQGQSELTTARAQLDYAMREAARQKALLAQSISSQNQADQAVLAERTARAAVAAAQQHNASLAAALSGKVAAPIADQPAVRRAQAALDQARLNLSYTVVRAAQDGVVTKVPQLQVGSYVTAAKPVFTLAGTHLWIEANFKENQLDQMRIGQPATVRLDAFPSLHLRARLASFSPGTGNSFALLPAENATGNWVKVVQRLPVEFEIENPPAGVPLHAGLSAEVTVDTRGAASGQAARP